MNDNEKIVKDVADAYAAETDEKFLKEIKEAKNDPKFANNKETDKKYAEIINKKKKTGAKSVLLHVASLIVVIAAGLTIAAVTADSFRLKTLELITNIKNHTYSTIFTSDKDDEKLLAGYQGEYLLTWIPEGYYADSVKKHDKSDMIQYKNKNNCYIIFEERDFKFKEHLDSENLDNYDEFVLNEDKALYINKDGLTAMLTFKADKRVITITTNDETVDLKGLAKHIEKK